MKKWNINENSIKKSLQSVIKTKDIQKLSKDAYAFTMNLSGFIAHYNIEGFKSEYENVADLVRDLKNSSDIQDSNRYKRDSYFSEGEQKEYYASKSNILEFIAELIKDINISTTNEVVSFNRTVLTY